MMKKNINKRSCVVSDFSIPAQKTRILILCTGNSIRSIMAEAILNRLGEGRVQAYSAGSQPVGVVNMHVENLLISKGYNVETLHSKSWMAFAKPNDPDIDLVISLCETADQFIGTNWSSCPKRIYWAFPDVSGFHGRDRSIMSVFEDMYNRLYHALARPLDLPLEKMSIPAICDAMTQMQTGRGIERLS